MFQLLHLTMIDQNILKTLPTNCPKIRYQIFVPCKSNLYVRATVAAGCPNVNVKQGHMHEMFIIPLKLSGKRKVDSQTKRFT
ncbi:hypothetical protein SAMN02745220_05209 [Desulfopila aestuarii DSM 18488]|uniref:Uncharacterized protein n=1 Tax=Desulfopila aestuarii DSM 18488 TaxID=1121416 RepID=A0A1M7YLS5_9BACT|nr:hypothetical protein SAMN02745220_05209 [Desulfopila aestuarii DSM 18488]